jgi:hypothetical protein
MRAEETARKAADLQWLHDGFAYAKQVVRKGSWSSSRPT